MSGQVSLRKAPPHLTPPEPANSVAPQNNKLRLALTISACIGAAGGLFAATAPASAANIFSILFADSPPAPAPVTQPPRVTQAWQMPGPIAEFSLKPPQKHYAHRQKPGDMIALKKAPAALMQLSESTSAAPGGYVCVRQCDGFFFPVDSAATQETCAGLCPNAAVSLYHRPAGSDNIADAVSATGARYSALPAAFRNQTTRDSACSCRSGTAQNFSLQRDATLRTGDAVMTPEGFRVFNGAAQLPHHETNFTSLAKAPLPHDRIMVLAAMERVTLPGLGPLRGAAGLIDVPARAASTSSELTVRPSGNQKIRIVEAADNVTQ